jgi:hypothetical protein
MRRSVLGAMIVLMMSQVAGTAQPQQFDLDCHQRQWRRPYKLSLSPQEAQSYFIRALLLKAQYDSPARQPRGLCQLHHGWFVLNWLKGQSHSGSKSSGALKLSMGRKSSLHRDRQTNCRRAHNRVCHQSRDLGEALVAPLAPAIFDSNSAALLLPPALD